MMKRWSFSVAALEEQLAGEAVSIEDRSMMVSGVVSSGEHSLQQSIFVAVRGTAADGHDHIGQAFDNGAILAVVTDAGRLGGRPGIVVQDGRRALSTLCAAFTGHASRALLTVGITGTNGKTTVHWLLHHALERLGCPGIRIGSLGISAFGKVEHSSKVTVRGSGDILMTTPGPIEIHGALREAVDQGLESCVLETSSHAIDQFRTADVFFDAAVFTNLSRDHLNYHGDMESYFAAKVRLFRQLALNPNAGGAAVNVDCEYGRRLAAICDELSLPVLSFGEAPGARVRIAEFCQQLPQSNLHLVVDGTRHTITTPLIGDYNASNLAAAFAGLLALGFPAVRVESALCDLPCVPGRLEAVGTDDVAVFVDYAHTGEGLHNVLAAVRGFARKDLWVVFGCGGGKDPGKREAMGKAAAELADHIVLTSDNPRNEDPEKIVREILASGCRAEIVELDRRSAIEKTLSRAVKGDVVVLAGKGHEDYQISGDQTLHFSDQEEVLRCRKLGLLDRTGR